MVVWKRETAYCIWAKQGFGIYDMDREYRDFATYLKMGEMQKEVVASDSEGDLENIASEMGSVTSRQSNYPRNSGLEAKRRSSREKKRSQEEKRRKKSAWRKMGKWLISEYIKEDS